MKHRFIYFQLKVISKTNPTVLFLIIGPFNYPVQLVFEPLIGAIAAGNTAIVKPSELTPNVAEVIQDIIQETFEENYISVVKGGIEETQTLIHLLFDYMFSLVAKKLVKSSMNRLLKIWYLLL